jgi:hypothetical protein
MKRICPLILTCITLLAFPTTAAQDDDTSGWPVAQRCVGEPTAPPAGWTFEGTILMTGYAGIHAVQADWETPRVVVFLNRDWGESDSDLPGGALSPNGRWYASPYGSRVMERSYNVVTTLNEI